MYTTVAEQTYTAVQLGGFPGRSKGAVIESSQISSLKSFVISRSNSWDLVCSCLVFFK